MMYKFELPSLPYAYDALIPWVDAKTMEIHHTKHHQAYVNKLNQALEDEGIKKYPKDLADFSSQIGSYQHMGMRNNLGGHYNHTLFWGIISPKGGGEPSGELAKSIKAVFGSVDNFRKEFTQKALGQFGSGWAWLAVNKAGKLFVTSTPNQDNPLMDVIEEEKRGIPLLGLDVWEHAYYLKYQNRRPEYVDAFWKVVNWNAVADHYTKALEK